MSKYFEWVYLSCLVYKLDLKSNIFSSNYDLRSWWICINLYNLSSFLINNPLIKLQYGTSHTKKPLYYLPLLPFSECDQSCLECTGPRKSDCISCSNSTNVILRSKCVTECGTGYYIRDNICYRKYQKYLSWKFSQNVQILWQPLIQSIVMLWIKSELSYMRCASRLAKIVNFFATWAKFLTPV